MHGKAQCPPAWHSVVLDCKLVPLHSTCESLPAVCCIMSMRHDGSVSHCENLGGGQKLANCSQPFLDQSLSNLGACRGVPVD